MFQTTNQYIIQWVYPLYPMGLSPIDPVFILWGEITAQ